MLYCEEHVQRATQVLAWGLGDTGPSWEVGHSLLVQTDMCCLLGMNTIQPESHVLLHVKERECQAFSSEAS